MRYYNVGIAEKTTLRVNKSVVGEKLEDRVARMLYSQEAINDGAPLIYTDRRRGVMAEHDIRTDRFEVALDAMNGVVDRNMAKRANYYEIKKETPDNGVISATE